MESDGSFHIMMLALILGAACASVILGYCVLKMAPYLGLVDLPNVRSSHSIPTPRGGGISFVLTGIMAGMVLYWGTAEAAALVAIALLAAVGLLDDIYTLPAWIRFAVQGIVVASTITVLGDIPAISLFEASLLGFRVDGWLLAGVLLVGGVWWINLFNFMDGIDGIAGVQGITMLFSSVAILLLSKEGLTNSNEIMLGIVIAAAVGGFLVFNWPPARIFMGDVGSTWLAAMIFFLALSMVSKEMLGYAVWLLLGAVFICDSTITLIVRVLKREQWYKAHRSHTYQLATEYYARIHASGDVANTKVRRLSHRWVTTWVLAINTLWVFPLALLVSMRPEIATPVTILGYSPLVIGCVIAQSRLASNQ